MRRRLAQPRPSLSPSAFSDRAFEHFQDYHDVERSEQDIRAIAMPAISGQENQHLISRGSVFGALESFDPTVKRLTPDKYYGARPDQIDFRVRRDLGQYMVPSKSSSRPAAPNHFVEVKGHSCGADVPQRQTTFAGAVGARGMLHLQNYGRGALAYDNNSYTTTATCFAGTGTLQIFATHPTQTATSQTQYHMTRLGSYLMTDDIDSFRRGAAAFRNARDMGEEHRTRLIAAANATAQGLPSVTRSNSPTTTRTGLSSVPDNESFGSDTSTDELAPGYEQSPKRRRIRSVDDEEEDDE